MDTYIAAEDVVIITAPVDILNKEEFEEELLRLDSPRAKADAIRTRMTKSITGKWDENPSYYKTFSKRIEEIIADYKAKRISDADYLRRMSEVKEDYRKGYSGITYPQRIRHNVNAQAFYGVVKEALESDSPYSVKDGMMVHEGPEIYDYENILADVAVDVDLIIKEHSKVDGHDNPDVHTAKNQKLGFKGNIHLKALFMGTSLPTGIKLFEITLDIDIYSLK